MRGSFSPVACPHPPTPPLVGVPFFVCIFLYFFFCVCVRAPSWCSCGGTWAWRRRTEGRCPCPFYCLDKWAWSVWPLWLRSWRGCTPPTGGWHIAVASSARGSGAASWWTPEAAAVHSGSKANRRQVCSPVTAVSYQCVGRGFDRGCTIELISSLFPIFMKLLHVCVCKQKQEKPQKCE